MSAVALVESRLSLSSPLLPDGEAPAADAATVADWQRITDELLRLRKLGADWDGQGSQALDSKLVDVAIRWVSEMRRWSRALPPTRAVPGTTGELVLEWRADSYLLAAELAEPDHIDWLLRVPGQPIKQWQTDAQTLWIIRAER